MRGATRTLVGFIFGFGAIAELFLTTHTHSFIDVVMLVMMLIVGIEFVHWGYIARHDRGIC